MRKAALIVLLIITSLWLRAQDFPLQEGLALKYLVRQPANPSAASPVIILLHGYGSDEKDLFALRNVLPPHYLLISARAPFAVPSSAGFQWYDLAAAGKPGGKSDELRTSTALITKFISEVTAKYKVGSGPVYVIGFSQGAVMAFSVGLQTPPHVQGVAALSGRIYKNMKDGVKKNANLKQLRVFVANGTADNRIPFVEGSDAAGYFKEIGTKCSFHIYKGLGHSISNEVMTDLLKWLNGVDG